jgi:hypothetical protein
MPSQFHGNLGVKLIIITSGAQIANAFGRGASYFSIITSALLALTSFFYIYTVGSFFKFDIYFLQNRITYFTFFHNYVINQYADHILIASAIVLWLLLSVREAKKRYVLSSIYGGLTVLAVFAKLGLLLDVVALVSIPLVVLLLAYNRFFAANVLKAHTTWMYVNYLALIGIATGIISIIITILTPEYSALPASTFVPNYAHGLFALFSSLSPSLIVLLALCLPVRLLLSEIMTKVFKIKNSMSSFLSAQTIKTRSKIVLLSVFMLMSVALAAIPHEPAINKTNRDVATDTAFYVGIINKLAQSKDPQEFIRVLEEPGDRPLTLLFLFTMAKLTPADPSYTIDRMAILFGPVLVLVFFFLTRELTSNDTTSILSAFLTAISFHTLIGIYAGFHANWLAIIIGYLSFVFLIKFLKAPHKRNLAIYSALIALLLFTHVYTWTVFTIVTIIFLVVLLKLNYYQRHSIFLLLLVILSSIAIDIARTTITGTSGGIEGDLIVSKHFGAGLDQFNQRWTNLVYAIQVHLGGQLSNPIILILGLYWILRCKLSALSSIFLVVFLSVGILPLFVGSVTIQSRLFYDLPLQIPAAMALTYLKKKPYGTMLLFPIGIWLIAISINAASNFYFLPP